MHSLPSPPLIAILRGLTLTEVPSVGKALFTAGFRIVEVPLNRPQALDCIAALQEIAPAGSLIGAGTVLSVADVANVAAAGGHLVVSPNCDPAVIEETRQRGLVSAPGIATPSEAFQALKAGAQVLKLFPAEVMGIRGVAALRSVLPADTLLFPVGGIDASNMATFYRAGANGFGIGSSLYRPKAVDVAAKALEMTAAWQQVDTSRAVGD